MRFVQYKEDVIWKEGRMCLRGKPFEVTDSYALGVFSTDPQFEKVQEQQFKEKQDEKEVQRKDPEAGVLKGKACTHCRKIIPRGWYFHDKHCKG